MSTQIKSVRQTRDVNSTCSPYAHVTVRKGVTDLHYNIWLWQQTHNNFAKGDEMWDGHPLAPNPFAYSIETYKKTRKHEHWMASLSRHLLRFEIGRRTIQSWNRFFFFFFRLTISACIVCPRMMLPFIFSGVRERRREKWESGDERNRRSISRMVFRTWNIKYCQQLSVYQINWMVHTIPAGQFHHSVLSSFFFYFIFQISVAFVSFSIHKWAISLFFFFCARHDLFRETQNNKRTEAMHTKLKVQLGDSAAVYRKHWDGYWSWLGYCRPPRWEYAICDSQ